MQRRTYLSAIATLIGGSVAGCSSTSNSDSHQTMTKETAKDVFTHIDELETSSIDGISSAHRFVDSDLNIVFHAFEPAGAHAGDGATVTSQKLSEEELKAIE